MIMTGYEFKKWVESWPDGYTYCDGSFMLNDMSDCFCIDDCTDLDKIKIESSAAMFHEETGHEIGLLRHYKQWKKSFNFAIITVEIPIDKQTEVVNAIKLAGGKVIK